LPNQQSRRLAAPITVIGERIKQLGARCEFAKVELTVHPSESFEVIDRVAERSELEKLGVEWPDCAIFGLLDVLMVTELGPLYKVCVVWKRFGITKLIRRTRRSAMPEVRGAKNR